MGASYKDLVVWQRGMELSAQVYGFTSAFPRSEQFGLTNQLRRASVSIPSNIAEGFGRCTKGEFLQFLGHARGSNCELQTQLILSETLGFGSKEQRDTAEHLSADVSRLVIALMKKLKE